MSKRSEILEASLNLFAENGFNGTSLKQIADAVAIKKPSLYAHFDSKEALFLNVCQSVFRDYVSFIEHLLHGQTGCGVEGQLKAVLTGNFKYYSENGMKSLFLKRVTLFPPVNLKQEMRITFQTFETETSKVFVEIFRSGIDEGSIKPLSEEHLLNAFYCLIDGLTLEMLYYEPDEYQKRMEHAWEVFWNGIKMGD